MELVGSGPDQRSMDLFDYIAKERQDRLLSESEARVIFLQIVSALKHIHDQEVIHGDIKCENVMVSVPTDPQLSPKVKLIDFGCATFKRQGAAPMLIEDSFSPPEAIIEGASSLGNHTDIYRLGCVLYIMIQSCPPFEVPDEHGKFTSAQRKADFYKGFRWNTTNMSLKLSSEMKDLLQCLLSFDPTDRPSCDAILTHSWMRRGSTLRHGHG